jgi:hypothetical protein
MPLAWIVEYDAAGIVQLAEPLLVRQTNAIIQRSLIGLKVYMQGRANPW